MDVVQMVSLHVPGKVRWFHPFFPMLHEKDEGQESKRGVGRVIGRRDINVGKWLPCEYSVSFL